MERTLVDADLIDRDGNTVGKITDVIPDAVTLEPRWYTVKTSRLGREHLVPAAVIEDHDGKCVVGCDKDTIKHAPVAKDHAAPTAEEREALEHHYGLSA